MKLEELLKSDSLPTLPTVAVQVLDLANDPESGIGDIADVLRLDPAITGQIIKAANSSRYGLSQPVTSIDRAVSLLGKTAVAATSLAFSLCRQAEGDSALSDAHNDYWKSTVLSAVAAEELAGTRSQAGDYFLAGLLTNVGQLALLNCLGAEYVDLLAQVADSHDRLVEVELNRLGFTHIEAGCRLIEEWGLPDWLVEAIQHHHDDVSGILGDVTESSRVAAAVYVASHVADLFTNNATSNAAVLVDSVCGSFFGTDTQELLHKTREKMDEIGSVFEINSDSLPPAVEVMAQANRSLAELLMRESAARTESEEKLRESIRENDELRDSVGRDRATGALTRDSFDELVFDQLAVASGRFPNVAVLMIEPDNLDLLKAEFGKSVHETLLREITTVMSDCVGACDLVARFDQHQLVALMHTETAEDVEAVADRMRSLVNSTPVIHDGHTVPCTISVGGIVFVTEDNSGDSFESLQQAAWFRLDQAKRAGGDRVSLSNVTRRAVG